MEALIGNPTTFVSEIIWTVINFFLLLFLLKRFLYNPIIRFTEERQARMDAKLLEEKDAKARVAENEERILNEKTKSREEARQLLAQSADALEKQHAQVMSEARAASSKRLKDGEAELAERRDKTAEKLREATPELAALLSKRLLNEE
jgi:F-type H+-transporting ATPase subunit b